MNWSLKDTGTVGVGIADRGEKIDQGTERELRQLGLTGAKGVLGKPWEVWQERWVGARIRAKGAGGRRTPLLVSCGSFSGS